MTAQTGSGWKLIGLWMVFGVSVLLANGAGWFEPGGWLAWLAEPSPSILLLIVGWFLMRSLSPSQLTLPLRETSARLEAVSESIETLSQRMEAQEALLEEFREDLGVSPNQKSYQLLCRELLGDVPSYEDYCNPDSEWNQRIRKRWATSGEAAAADPGED